METFLKKIAKIQFYEENQCCTMLYFCVSRIFDKISFLKLWTIKKIIKKCTIKNIKKQLNRNFLKKNREKSNKLIVRKMNVVQCLYQKYIKDIGVYENFDFLKLWTIKKIICTIKNIKKQSIETFLKKIAKIQFFEENQCRTMLYLLYIKDLSWNFIFWNFGQ